MLILSKLLPPFWKKIRASSRKCNFLGFQTSCCANGQAKLGLLRELLSLVQHYSDGGSVGGTVFPPLGPHFCSPTVIFSFCSTLKSPPSSLAHAKSMRNFTPEGVKLLNLDNYNLLSPKSVLFFFEILG